MIKKVFVFAIVAVAFAFQRPAFSQTTTASPKQPNRVAVAAANVKELLLLMDTDKNGKISKQEWMNFMSAEFDRLDTDKSGELDPKELMRSRISVPHVRSSDQGK